MSNLPVVPGVPSSAEVDAMKRAMAAVHGNVPAVHETQAHYSGGSQGRARINESVATPYMPSFGTSAEDVQQMKNLLERLEQINGGGEQAQPQNLSEGRRIAGGAYHVSECIVEANGQEKQAFNVGDGSQVVAEALSIKEAAEAVAMLLNKGEQLNGQKVQEVLTLEETYYRNRIEAGTVKARYQRAVQLGESEAAEVFKSRFNKVKAEALLASDQIKSIRASIR